MGHGAIQSRVFDYHGFSCLPPKTMGYLKRTSSELIFNQAFPLTIRFSDHNLQALVSLKATINSFLQSIQISQEEIVPHYFEEPFQADFLTCPIQDLVGALDVKDVTQTFALLLNPPYGIRLGKQMMKEKFYQQIATRIVEIHQHLRNHLINQMNSNRICPLFIGYCICPSQSTWTTLLNTLSDSQLYCETHHFSHGGRDMRLVAFSSRLGDEQNSVSLLDDSCK